MSDNYDNIYYVEYKPKLSPYSDNSDYLYAIINSDSKGECFIDSETYDSLAKKLINFKKSSNYGLISGNVFEKDETNKYDVKVELFSYNTLIDSLVTTNGFFNFGNLNLDVKYSLRFIDLSNKYNSKIIDNILPSRDDTEQPEIILYSELKIKSDYIEYYFGINSIGNPQVYLVGAPQSLNVTRYRDGIYVIKGFTNNTDLDFEIFLDDYRSSGIKQTSKRITLSKTNYINFKFNNTLSDTSGKYTAIQVGSPVLTNESIKIDSRANSISLKYNDIFYVNIGSQFSFYIDFMLNSFKDSTVGNKYILCTNNSYGIQLLLEDSKYLKFNIITQGQGTYTLVSNLSSNINGTANQIELNKRYKIKIEYDGLTLLMKVNDKIFSRIVTSNLSPYINGSENLIFGGPQLSVTGNTQDTVFDLYEFRFNNGNI